MKKFFIIIVVIIILMTLCSCRRAIENYADELVLSEWQCVFDNSAVISLKFCNDDATINLSNKNDKSSAYTISGFCEISSDCFVIHDKATGVPYSFNYNVTLDHVVLTYDGGTISLDKKK